MTHQAKIQPEQPEDQEPDAAALPGGATLTERERERENPLRRRPLVLETREDWPCFFGRRAPIEVEIGFGYGHFLLEYSGRRPDIDFVGFEVRASLAAHVCRRAKRLGRTNVTVLRGDARRLLPALFGAGQISAVHIQFPDPWWKKRHHRRRLVDSPMVTLLHGLLDPGGKVFLRTDVQDYGLAMISEFEDGTERFENLDGPGTFAATDRIAVPSNRERRYLAAGTPVYRLAYRRR